eukprot:677094-Pleurochrysis_carterae.AAC.2
MYIAIPLRVSSQIDRRRKPDLTEEYGSSSEASSHVKRRYDARAKKRTEASWTREDLRMCERKADEEGEVDKWRRGCGVELRKGDANAKGVQGECESDCANAGGKT